MNKVSSCFIVRLPVCTLLVDFTLGTVMSANGDEQTFIIID